MNVEFNRMICNDGGSKPIKYVDTDDDGHLYLTQKGKDEVYGAIAYSLFDAAWDSITGKNDKEEKVEEEEPKAVEKEKDPVGDLLFDILGIYLYSKYSQTKEEPITAEDKQTQPSIDEDA